MKILYKNKIYNWGETSRILIYRCKNCYSFFIIDIELIDRLINSMYVCNRCNNQELNNNNNLN